MKIDYRRMWWIHGTLRDLLEWIEADPDDDIEEVNTSNLRPDDSGVHGTIPLRGWDLRDLGRERSIKLVDKINAKWIYDPKRPWKKVAMYHKNRGAPGYHVHLQVHPNTMMIR